MVIVKDGVVNNLDGYMGEVDATGEVFMIGFKDKDGNVFPKGVGLTKLQSVPHLSSRGASQFRNPDLHGLRRQRNRDSRKQGGCKGQ